MIKQDSFYGDQLRLVRLFHGMSQAELGERISTSRQFIHQLENGSKAPSNELLKVLASALGVRTAFFEERPVNLVRQEQCHFRKLQTTPLSTVSQVLARSSLFEKLVTFLEDELDFPTVDFPTHEVSSVSDIERVAEKCRIHWGLGLGGPIDNMMRVVENAGAVVTHFEEVSKKVDALSISRPRPLIVRSLNKQNPCRLRFDLAHECGHLIMHEGAETGDRPSEAEADRFASAFLMPRTAFAAEFPKGARLNWQAIYSLKARWKVSVRAIVRRAYDLDLIDSVGYRKANIYLSKTGQTKSERGDSLVPIERPELLDSALTALNEKNNESESVVCNALQIELPTYFKLVGRSPTNDNLPLAAVG